jgi:hypothetical protein
MAALRALALACGYALLALPADAAVLYKSVSPEGVVQFSDLPPEKGRIIDRINITDSGTPSVAPPGTPGIAMGPAMSEEQLRAADAAVARASAQVDLAEHALAVARRSVWSEPEPTRLTAITARMTRSDIERIEFYKKNVLVARQTLLEVLQEKRRAAVTQQMTASAGEPIYGPLTAYRR